MATEAVKNLTGMSSPVDEVLSRYARKRQEPEQIIERSMREQSEFQAQEAADKAQREATRARSKAAGFRQEAASVRDSAEQKSLQSIEQRMMDEATFVPTKETAGDMAQLFALINIAGFAMGAGGKRNAQAAMSGMNGMMEGYQQGRADLYKKEKDVFESNLKALKTKSDILTRRLQEVAKLAQTDRLAADAEADALFAEQGASFMKQFKDKYGLAGVIEYNKQRLQSIDKAMEIETRLREKESQARRQAEADARAQRREERAEFRFERAIQKATQSAESKNLKPPPKEIVAQNQLRNNIIPKLVESLPVLERLNKEGNWNTMTALLAIDPRAAEFKFKDDPEALNLILTLAYFRSKEFETAGKALTKKEDQILAPIVRGDLRVYEGIKNAMEQGLKSLKQEQKGLEGTYPFIKEFNRAMRGETEDSGASSSTPSKYSIGQIIKRGNKSYRVTGLSDPNNPDIEEVK